jgi:ribose transport system substrate-binding protein
LVREEQFFREFVAERYPNLNYVGNATHDGSANDAVAQYQAYVGANPELDAVFFGDGLGPSIADALVDAKPEIKLVLRGFGQNGLDAIKAGAVLAAVDRSPFDEEFWGFMPLYFAVNGGYRAPDTMIVPTFAVDASNIEAFIEAPYRDATQWAAS